MKKTRIIIILIILVAIIAFVFINKTSNQNSKEVGETTQNVNNDNLVEIKSVNPGAESIKVLGETTETKKTEQETSKETKLETPEGEKNKNKPQKVIFETAKLYSLINSYRKDKKLSPLNVNQSLEVSAKRKIADMIENNYFRHEDTENLESWYLFKTAGYEYITAGENLSSGINTPWQVFDAWKNSEIHDAQLTNETYMDMGISADCESYKIASKPSCIVVLHLGSK